MVVSYEGTAYHGWQAQSFLESTVQTRVQQALSRIADHPVEVVCAGRTDAGVHATAQVFHFDTTSRRNAQAWVKGGNHFLPDDIALLWAGAVADDFHARYSARSRCYRYLILNSYVRPALAPRNLTWWYPRLDAAAMARAGQALIGEHDFSAFRDAECQSRTPMRSLSHLAVWREGDVVVVEVRANAFLHHMVRNIVGTLLEVGMQRRSEGWIADVLSSRDRRVAGVTAPAAGLYFVQAEYPEHFGIPFFPKGPIMLAGAANRP